MNKYNSSIINRQELIQKIENALKKLKEPNILLSSSLMEYKEIAMMLDDKQAIEWVENQLEGYKDTMILSDYRKEVKVEDKMETFTESISLLEEELKRKHDILPDATNSPINNLIMFYNVQRRRAILDTLDWVRQKSHTWLVKKLIDIKSGYLPESIFIEIQQFVDTKIKNLAPAIANRFAAIHDDLASSNQAKWANAILSCREILRHLADKLFPLTNEITSKNGHKLGKEEYRNRLIEFIKQKSNSEKFTEIFGSTLQNFTDRLEAIYNASCKGKFLCKTKEEAKRHVIYTYMLVADILKLTS